MGLIAKILHRFNTLLLALSAIALLTGLLNMNIPAIEGDLGAPLIYSVPISGIILAITMIYDTRPVAFRDMDLKAKFGLCFITMLLGTTWMLLTRIIQGIPGYPITLYCLGIMFAISPLIALSHTIRNQSTTRPVPR